MERLPALTVVRLEGEMVVTAHCDGLCSIVKGCAHHTHKLRIILVTRPCLAGLEHKYDASYTVNMSVIFCRDMVRPFFILVGNLPGGDQDLVFLPRRLLATVLVLAKQTNKQKTGKTFFYFFLLYSLEFYSSSGPHGILFTKSDRLFLVIGRQLGYKRDNSIYFRVNKVFWMGVLTRIC